jgi:hypothetical protein
VFTRVLGNGAKTNRSEVVDGKPGVLGVVEGKDVGEGVLHVGSLEALDKLGQAEGLKHFLHDNLDKDTT